jgi:hypothetical protein
MGPFVNRYYARTIARFTTPDPYGGSAKPGNPQSWNRYTYVGNDPVNRNDPSGLDWYDPFRGLYYPEDSISPYEAIMSWFIHVPGVYDPGWTPLMSPPPPTPLALATPIIAGLCHSDLVSTWWTEDDTLEVFSVELPADVGVFGFGILPQLAGAGAAGGVIVLGGGPITWTITVTGVVLTGVTLATVYVIDQIIQRHKADIAQVRAAARQVSREENCRRDLRPGDFDRVHEIIKDQKGPDGKVPYDALLAAWREVLCED